MSELPPEALAPDPGAGPGGPGVLRHRRCRPSRPRPAPGLAAPRDRGRRRAAASLVLRAARTRGCCCATPPPTAATWAPTSGSRRTCGTTCCRRGGSRAGRRTGSPGSRPASSTSRSRRCSSWSLDLVLPYNVAFKLVTALGPVLLPASAYVLGRGLHVRRPGPGALRGRRDAVPLLQGHRRGRPGTPQRDDPVQPADHGRPDRQRAGGGVLVHARARVRLSRSSARSRSRCGRAGGSGSPRCCSRRPCCATSSSASSWWSARSSSGSSTDRSGPSRSRPRSAPSARCSPRSGRSRCSPRSATRRTCATRSSPGTSTTCSRPSSGGSSRSPVIGAVIGLVRRDRAVLTLAHADGHVRGRVPALARAARVEPALPAVLVPRPVPARRGRRSPRSPAGVAQQVGLVWLGPPPGARTRTGTLDPVRRRPALPASVKTRDAPSAGRRADLRRRRSGARAQRNGASSTSGPSGTTPGYEDTSPSSTKPKPYGEYRELMDTMGRLPAGPRDVGGRPGDRHLRHVARADAAAVLDRRPHRVDGGPVLRVGGDDAVPLHGGRAALRAGQRVEPGARARLPHDRGLRPRRPVPAAARGPLLHGVLAPRRSSRPTRTRTCGSSRRSATATARRRSGWEHLRGARRRDRRAAAYEPVVVDAARRAPSRSASAARRSRASARPSSARGSASPPGWWNDPERARPAARGRRPGELGAGAAPSQADDARRGAGSRRSRSPTCARPTTRSRSDVSRTGVPVVVRTSYYPNWEADGADGPWRLTPNLMVVVPTSRSVTLHYARSGPEMAGHRPVTVVGVVGLVGLVDLAPAGPGRRRRRRAAGADPAPVRPRPGDRRDPPVRRRGEPDSRARKPQAPALP